MGTLGELGVAPEACARLASVAASGAADTTAFVRHYKAINMAGGRDADPCAEMRTGGRAWAAHELDLAGLPCILSNDINSEARNCS